MLCALPATSSSTSKKTEFEDSTQALELRVTVLELALRQKEEEEDLRKQMKQHSNSLEAAGRRLRLTRRVIAKMIHSMLVAAWDNMQGAFRAHMVQERALRMLRRAAFRITQRALVQAWESIADAFKAHRSHERALRITGRVLGNMRHAELVVAWEELRRGFLDHRANRAALRRLNRSITAMRHGFLVELWDCFKVSFMAHRAIQRTQAAQSRAIRKMSRVLAKLRHACVVDAWDVVSTRWLQESRAKAAQDSARRKMKYVIGRITHQCLAQGFHTFRSCYLDSCRFDALACLQALQTKGHIFGAKKLSGAARTDAMRHTYRALLGMYRNWVEALQVTLRYHHMATGASISRLTAQVEDTEVRKREVQAEIEIERGKRYKLQAEKEALEVELQEVLDPHRVREYRHAADELLRRVHEMESVIQAQKAELQERKQQNLDLLQQKDASLPKHRDNDEADPFVRRMEQTIERIDRYRSPG